MNTQMCFDFIGLKLKFNGIAEVAWQETHGQGGSKGYHAKESYFHTKLVLVGDGKSINSIVYLCVYLWLVIYRNFYKNGRLNILNYFLSERNSDVSIPAGNHEYPFSFQLPLNLPSSFEGEFGRVRYDIEAVVKRSWKFDYNTKVIFTVNALVDLNLQPVYMEKRDVSKEKSICCLCCKEGPISMKVEMPRTGYVPGEYVKFSVHSSNSSSRPVSAIVAYFIRV